MNIQREILLMDERLTEMGVIVIFQGVTCVTVAGDHHDFKTLSEIHAYLTGCLVFVQSRPFDQSLTDTETSQSEGS